MTLENTKTQFLNNRIEGTFYDSSLKTYKRKIEVFFEFLTKIRGVNDNNFEEFLRGIDEKAIKESIVYYVKNYSISFKSTIDLYITVIKAYFEFLSKNMDIKNQHFDSKKSYSKLKESIDKTIKDLGLATTEQKSPITEQTFKKILNKCNAVLNDPNIFDNIMNNKERSHNNPMTLFTSAIITKLIMLTGIKNQVIKTIKLSDYDPELNIIAINNFYIHLPNKLGRQMKLYLKIRENFANNSKDKDDPLFIKKDGSSIGTSYGDAFKVIKDIINSASAECVAKYTIMQMIKKGMNIYFIKLLTGFGIESCLHCQELVNDEKTNEDITSQNRYIDSKIRSMDIFDIL